MAEDKKPKYRLGRKKSRVILTQDGTKEIAVVSFFEGHEDLAKRVVHALNNEAALQLNKEEEWISVIDGMPEVDTPVLIITTSGVFKVDERFISRFSEDRNPKWRHTDEKYISSWMTLPSPPKVK